MRQKDVSIISPMVKLPPNLKSLEFKGIGFTTVQNNQNWPDLSIGDCSSKDEA